MYQRESSENFGELRATFFFFVAIYEKPHWVGLISPPPQRRGLSLSYGTFHNKLAVTHTKASFNHPRYVILYSFECLLLNQLHHLDTLAPKGCYNAMVLYVNIFLNT